MLGRGMQVLATLRRLRRTVAGAVVPALLSSVLTGAAACPATGAQGPRATQSAHDMPAAHHHEHAAHEHHAHDSARVPPAQPAGDCPHCLGGHATGTVTTADCDVVAVAPPTATHASTAATLVLPIESYAPPAASPVPPLIRQAARATRAPTPSVPLHIRHHVLLI